MRRLLLLLVLLPALAGCQGLLPGTPEPGEATALRTGPVDVHPDSLLARLVPAALDDAFASGHAMRHALDGGPATTADSVPNPLGHVLAEAPPFADPRSRDAYARRLVPTTWPRAAAAEALLTDASRTLPVWRAVVVVDTVSGRVLAAEAWRRSRSLVYDEDTHASVVRDPSTGRAARAHVSVEVDMAGSPPRRAVRTWTAAPAR